MKLGAFSVTPEIPIALQNPYDSRTDALLERYFEEYIQRPYDEVPVQAAPAAIERY